jgi:hypothetical protein
MDRGSAPQHQHRLAAPPPIIARGFVPWRLSDAGHRVRGSVDHGRHPKPCAKAAVSNRSKVAPLLDHLVGAGEQRRRHLNAERLSRLQVDDEFELARLYVDPLRIATWTTQIGYAPGYSVRMSPVRLMELHDLSPIRPRHDIELAAISQRKVQAALRLLSSTG